MEKCKCTCPPKDWSRWQEYIEPCEGCEEWWRLQSLLHDELRLPVYWPPYEHPDAGNPWPLGSEMWRLWKPNEKAIALYRALAAADRATRRRTKPRQAAMARSREP